MSSSETELSEEQKSFLEECENLFANRYTDDDDEFGEYKQRPQPSPPVVEPWYSRQRRSYGHDDRRRDRDNRDRREGGRSDRHDDRRRHDNYGDRDSWRSGGGWRDQSRSDRRYEPYSTHNRPRY